MPTSRLSRRRATPRQLLIACTFLLSLAIPSLAQDKGENAAKKESGSGPWITAIASEADSNRVWLASGSGLPLRPSSLWQSTWSGEAPTAIREFPASLWRVAVHGNEAVVCDYSGQVWIGPKDRGEGWTAWEPKLRWSRALCFLNDQKIVVGTEEGKLIVGDRQTKSWEPPRDGHTAAIFQLHLSADGQHLVSCGGEGQVKIWRTSDGGLERTLTVGKHAVWDTCLSPDGTMLWTADAARRVNAWEWSTGKLVQCLGVLPDWATSLTLVTPDTLAAGCLNGNVYLFDTKQGFPLATIRVASSGVWSLASQPAGQSLLVGTRSHGLRAVEASVWQNQTQSVRAEKGAEQPPSP